MKKLAHKKIIYNKWNLICLKSLKRQQFLEIILFNPENQYRNMKSNQFWYLKIHTSHSATLTWIKKFNQSSTIQTQNIQHKRKNSTTDKIGTPKNIQNSLKKQNIPNKQKHKINRDNKSLRTAQKNFKSINTISTRVEQPEINFSTFAFHLFSSSTGKEFSI